MRLLVDVDVATKSGTETQSFETTVLTVSRSIQRGVVSDEVVLVEAYIPPHHRRSIVAPLHSWKSSDVLRCSAQVKWNKKSLAEFLASGEMKLSLEGAY